ncbi:MAG: 50S ribosomal protein L31 [Clostridiales bacterium]|nr:MAG: 50S ribosomal protein L31 [Clostridiales bacterium]
MCSKCHPFYTGKTEVG